MLYCEWKYISLNANNNKVVKYFNRMGHDNPRDMVELFGEEESCPGELWTPLGEDWEQELLDEGEEPPFVMKVEDGKFYDLM